jgi:hypothetical protein
VTIFDINEKIELIATQSLNYDKYAVFANGSRVGDFTLALNAWVPRAPLEIQNN